MAINKTIEDFYLVDLEKQWEASLPKLSNKQLLTIFPQAKEIISQKIKKLEQERSGQSDAIKEHLATINQKVKEGFAKWFWREWVKISEVSKLLEIEKNLAKLKYLLFKPRKIKGMISEKEIEQALAVPIETIANKHTNLQKNGENLIGLCPFHQEKHPSFYIYLKTNSCWCFGCNQGASNIIHFARMLYGYSFKEAVQYLIGKN